MLEESFNDIDPQARLTLSTLGLRKLFRFGDLTFFDCAGVRLRPGKAHDARAGRAQRGTIYLRCADIAPRRARTERGLEFPRLPHLIAKMDDHDLWMVCFADPNGNSLALMQEAPKGHVPGPATLSRPIRRRGEDPRRW